jgi:hypothetical protein
MREAISESGKRLSSLVAENQTRALAALLQDLHGNQLTTKRKVSPGPSPPFYKTYTATS